MQISIRKPRKINFKSGKDTVKGIITRAIRTTLVDESHIEINISCMMPKQKGLSSIIRELFKKMRDK